MAILGLKSGMEEIDFDEVCSDIERKIEKIIERNGTINYTQSDFYLPMSDALKDRLPSLSAAKLLMLIYQNTHSLAYNLLTPDPPPINLNVPIIDGLYPLHLVVLTLSPANVLFNFVNHGAKGDVTCNDEKSVFSGMTPLEMALQLLRGQIRWKPEQSVYELLNMLCEKKMGVLLDNIKVLTQLMPWICHHDLIYRYVNDGKVIELAALLIVASGYYYNIPNMFLPSAKIPTDCSFGPPMTLRLFVATMIASLTVEESVLSCSGTHEEVQKCREKMRLMESVMKLLEFSHREYIEFDLQEWDSVTSVYDRERPKIESRFALIAEDGDYVSEVLQDGSRFSSQYLATSLFCIEPSLYQPCGILNSLMTTHDHNFCYDVLDASVLIQTITRLVDGKRLEELSLRDAYNLEKQLHIHLRKRFKEAPKDRLAQTQRKLLTSKTTKDWIVATDVLSSFESEAEFSARCDDAMSKLSGIKRLGVALQLLREQISWTQEQSVYDLLLMLCKCKKAEKLLQNIKVLVGVIPGIHLRDLAFRYLIEGKIIELSALLMLSSVYAYNLCTMCIPSALVPSAYRFGVPTTLRLFVASRIALLVQEEISLSVSCYHEEAKSCKEQIRVMKAVMNLLEFAQMGCHEDVNEEHESITNYFGQKLEDFGFLLIDEEGDDGIPKGSQDESAVGKVTPEYLNSSLFNVMPLLYQPGGIINSLMARTNDGVREAGGLQQTILRLLNGKKLEEMDLCRLGSFKRDLQMELNDQYKEALNEQPGGMQIAQKGRLFQQLSPHVFINKRSFHTLRTLPAAYYTSSRRKSTTVQVGAKKIWSLFSFVVKGRI